MANMHFKADLLPNSDLGYSLGSSSERWKINDLTGGPIEYIVGTQTAKTGSWTGVTKDKTLITGKTIAYKLPYDGSGNASLTLTYTNPDEGADTNSGAIPVYLNNTRVTTHYVANSVIIMVYDGTNWRSTDYWNSNSRDAGYGKISLTQSDGTTALTTNTTQLVAKTYNEAMTLTAGNKWVQFAGTNSSTAGSDVLTVAHSLSGVTAGNYGDSSAQTPGYGSTFNVPYISVDAAGHITSISSHTVKIPASDNTDTKVTQTNKTDSNEYRILLSGTADDTDRTEGSNKSTNLKFNPSTKILSIGGSISATGDLDLIGDANLNGETYADSITAGSLLVNGAANFVQIPTSPTPASGSNDTQIATTEFVTSAVTGLAGPMRFIGSLGTGGTATSLAAASDSNKGYAYKVITAGTYQSIAAKVGDMLISNGSSWVLIPSGDEPDGTVTSITPGNGLLNGTGTTAITTSGTLNINYGTSTAKIGTTAAGTATTVSRSDHVHAIDLATGDNDGQVKIAGTNVSVKGLGSNAYTSTAYLPLAGGTMTGAINRYYNAASTDPVLSITSNDKDVILFNIGHGTAAGTPASCWYKLIYKGTGSSPNNTLQLVAAKSTTESTAVEINEDGLITFNGTGIFKKTTDLSGTANNSPALVVGGLTTAAHLELDANEIQAKTNGTSTAPLYLNNDGGNVYINNNLAGRFTATPTSGQVVITDGTTGGIKSSGYTIAKSVPSNAVFTDTNNAVKQSESSTADWRKLLLHYKNDAASTTAVTDSTNQVYAAVGISAQPSTGTIRAAAYNVLDKVILQFNTTTNALDFVFT